MLLDGAANGEKYGFIELITAAAAIWAAGEKVGVSPNLGSAATPAK